MVRVFVLMSLLFLGGCFQVFADAELGGYIKELVSMSTVPEGDDLLDSLTHLRLNLKWYPAPAFRGGLEMRHRVFWGDSLRGNPEIQDRVDPNDQAWDLSKAWTSADNLYLHSDVDRLWVEWQKGDVALRVGKQRVNWGMNLVWNPNDIFNTFSYFEFDYEERPGTDAVSLTLYTGVTQSLQAVGAVGKSHDEHTLALVYRFNRNLYDMQVFAGVQEEEGVAGLGWAGEIGDGGFRGEVTWFDTPHPVTQKKGFWVGALSADYTFASSFYVHGELLYNEEGTPDEAGGNALLQRDSFSARTLSLARFSIFSEIGYTFSPLTRGGLAGIFNPDDNSFFVSPSWTWNILDNLDLLLLAQLFEGDFGTEFGNVPDLYSARLKWSF